MVVFVIALRHPDNAHNFAHVEQLLSITLNSIAGQTNQNFKVIVVCNQIPNVDINDDRIHFLEVGFDAPSKKKAAELENGPKFLDKGTKYLAGLLYAQQFNPEYLCIFDADDWIHRDFVKVILESDSQPVWYVNRGYMVQYQTKEYKSISGFNRYCGSCYVFNYKYLMSLADIKSSIGADSTQQEMVAATSEFFITELLANHTKTYRFLCDKGVTPKAIPLRAACWLQATGENVSGTRGRDNGVPIGDNFVTQFSLPNTMLCPRNANVRIKILDFLFASRSAFTWLKSKWTGRTTY